MSAYLFAVTCVLVQGCASSPESKPTVEGAPEAVQTAEKAVAVDDAPRGYPEVQLRHGYVLEMVCLGQEVPENFGAWSTEMTQELPDFQATWDESGAALLEETVDMFGKPFDREQMIATILVCNNWVPMGAPVIIPIWRFLDSASKDTDQDKLDHDMFVAVLFHEMLHVYIEDHFFPNLRSSTVAAELREANEPFMAIAHVHLAAIMMQVYKRSGQDELLKRVIELEKSYSPAYARAWEIVQERGPEVFLAEFGLQGSD